MMNEMGTFADIGMWPSKSPKKVELFIYRCS
jgi:hypothetical protein